MKTARERIDEVRSRVHSAGLTEADEKEMYVGAIEEAVAGALEQRNIKEEERWERFKRNVALGVEIQIGDIEARAKKEERARWLACRSEHRYWDEEALNRLGDEAEKEPEENENS